MKANNLTITYDSSGKVILTISLAEKVNTDKLNKLATSEKVLDVEVKQHREKRSKTANGYLFVLCDKMATVLYSTKEEVYQECIRKVGVFKEKAVSNEDVEDDIRHHSGQGLGNYAEVTEKAKQDGYKVVRYYYGSSSYNTKEFSRLLEYIVEECKAQDIDTETPEEIERLVNMIK